MALRQMSSASRRRVCRVLLSIVRFPFQNRCPVEKAYGFTTFSGVPFRNALILFTVQSMIRWRLP